MFLGPFLKRTIVSLMAYIRVQHFNLNWFERRKNE